ncbi:coenzyme F420-0:L-glutamate ligase [Archaeoglobus neptunius]|uniref:coenzyme F420-0:L-glutamate ligase n=1 Tax=Archaeoglobus neptunius TaxID=2798580 RepID=UPI001925DA41|nr:coenzyme F420-0:L-glutamate ligase [Archaeoglobus neptunius]
MRSESVEIIPVRGLPIIKEGDDIAEMIADKVDLADGDVVVVCSTVVSKAEGRVRELSSYNPSEKALILSRKLGKPPEFIQAVIEESHEILLDFPFLLVKAKFGNVCVNAGIDGSNIDEGRIILPPTKPDESAKRLRDRIKELTGKSVGVVITDTNGRCFRRGVVGFAIGVAGIKAMRDWVGEKDLYGRELEVTVECVADEIAAFANLLMGEGGDGIPVVVIRGLDVLGEGSMEEIYRPEEEDVIIRCLKKCS